MSVVHYSGHDACYLRSKLEETDRKWVLINYTYFYTQAGTREIPPEDRHSGPIRIELASA